VDKFQVIIVEIHIDVRMSSKQIKTKNVCYIFALVKENSHKIKTKKI